MSPEQHATSIFSERSGVPSYKIRRGDIIEDERRGVFEFSKITEAAREMQTIPLYIAATGGISIAELVSRARRLKRQRGLDVLFIDYLQLLSASARRSE